MGVFTILIRKNSLMWELYETQKSIKEIPLWPRVMTEKVKGRFFFLNMT